MKEYFLQLGDVADVMQNILTDALEKSSLTSALTAETLKQSGNFYKNTVSSKYAYQNIMQEWFSDLVVKVICIFSAYDIEYISQWLNLKFRAFIHENKERMPSTLTYEARVNFGESIFLNAMDELGMDTKGLLILRSLYIPYTSLYYLKPMTAYPHYEQWVEQLKKYMKGEDI